MAGRRAGRLFGVVRDGCSCQECAVCSVWRRCREARGGEPVWPRKQASRHCTMLHTSLFFPLGRAWVEWGKWSNYITTQPLSNNLESVYSIFHEVSASAFLIVSLFSNVVFGLMWWWDPVSDRVLHGPIQPSSCQSLSLPPLTQTDHHPGLL